MGLETTEKRGKVKLTSQKFKLGPHDWQKDVTLEDRMKNVQKIVNTFYCTKSGPHPRRIDELMWFSREMEIIFYSRADNRYLYDGGIESMIQSMQIAINRDPYLTKIRQMNEIPSTEHLEKLFTFSAPREKLEDDELLAKGAEIIKLITNDRFEIHDLNIEPQPIQPILAEKKRKQLRNGPNNRKIVMARYSKRPETEERTMIIEMPNFQEK
ncbi:uncharacterized protein CELE_E01B7.2 [Caenorhabditis elegans]|uniref:Uncharacterized protein n=1 Tax=Caenorhabditis elegans TaxID=6239 RepID=Q9U3K8_CAEEL|nr:Uncharacterized protein CELE_E01B7.2 [Caenorhabditis elegans]CAB54214.2 Uncharacterized protein CELE_E01B7.2 [Caenorhabditis elegans]|eukprot:NP_507512.2 Uncharacterized protein CELE_E01B7.2 [Caenorhabditis elegans]